MQCKQYEQKHLDIQHTWERPPYALPQYLKTGFMLTLKSELPAKSNCACYMLACILTQIWMDLAGLAGEENQVGTSFSVSLSLTDRRDLSLIQKRQEKKSIHSCESTSQAPLRRWGAPLCF